MIRVFNDKGNIETGYLSVRSEYKEELRKYRNILLEMNSYNYDYDVRKVEKIILLSELCSCKEYLDRDMLVEENVEDFVRWIVPFEKCRYHVVETRVRCNNLITIQMLTKLLKDTDIFYSDKILRKYMEFGMIDPKNYDDEKLGLGRSLHLSGIEKLMENDRITDLASFRNSFVFLKYDVLPSESINKDDFSKEEIDNICVNTEILFGNGVKTLRK